jgi:nucleotide-binding universal stress UspA family protein
MFEKILVCLDGSSISEEILPFVTEEALAHSSKVVLLRVVGLPEVLIPINIPGEPGIPISTAGAVRRISKEENEANDYLKGIARLIRKEGLKVQRVVLHGSAGESIINYVQEHNCKLIAIATHGHGGIRRIVLGSTADFVLRNSPIPLLMVRPGNKKS